MARHTNQTFLYTDRMRWEPLIVKNSVGRAWIKTLSWDEETGARSALIKYDPGFTQEAHTAEWPADIYVLDGEMTAGDKSYNKATYHYRPGGSKVGRVSTRSGVTRLVMTADSKTDSSRQEVWVQDVYKMPWGPTYSNIDPTGQKGGTRMLREDKDRRLTVIIHSFFIPERSLINEGHRHNHTEEAFTLEGEMEDYLGDVDGHVMWMPGTYAFRQPNASLHGDTNKKVVPVTNIIRRGWVGDTEQFHHAKDNVRAPIAPTVTFSE